MPQARAAARLGMHSQQACTQTHVHTHVICTHMHTPHPGKELEIEFNEKTGQTALIRCKVRPHKQTDRQLIYTWLTPICPPIPIFLCLSPRKPPSSLTFPAYCPFPKHLIVNASLAFCKKSQMPIGSNIPLFVSCSRKPFQLNHSGGFYPLMCDWWILWWAWEGTARVFGLPHLPLFLCTPSQVGRWAFIT